MVDNCFIVNKSSGPTIYRLSTGFRRELAPFERRLVPVSELEELVQVPGGREILRDFILVEDPSVVEKVLNEEMENEYWLTKEQMPGWMNSCSLDEFKDALDLAPLGTLEMIKECAVAINLNDYNKRQAIKDQLGFDVSAAIEAKKQNDIQKKGPTTRRAASTIKKPTIVVNKPTKE